MPPDGWSLESGDSLALLKKIRSAGVPLGEFVKGRFYYGIKTGFNEAFVVDRATRDTLIAEHPSSAEVLKPFLRGRDVKRWKAESKDLWLIFTRQGIDIKKYPAILRHLTQFRKQLEPRPKDWPAGEKWEGRKPGPYKWYEIQDNIAYYREFKEEKIIYPDIRTQATFAVVESGFYSGDTTAMCIPPVDLWSVAAILNHPISEWFMRSIAPEIQGGFLRFKPMYVTQIPLPPSFGKSTDPWGISQLAKQAARNGDEVELEARIFSLYGLDADEIRVIRDGLAGVRSGRGSSESETVPDTENGEGARELM